MKIKLTNGRAEEILIGFRHSLDRTVETRPRTFVTITWTDREGKIETFTGEARVHPNDQPLRRVGRKIALARALKAADLSKKERTQIWAALVKGGMRVG